MSDRTDIAYALRLIADAVDNHKPVTSSATLRRAADLLDEPTPTPTPPKLGRDPVIPASPIVAAEAAARAREAIRAAREASKTAAAGSTR